MKDFMENSLYPDSVEHQAYSMSMSSGGGGGGGTMSPAILPPAAHPTPEHAATRRECHPLILWPPWREG